MCAVGSLLLVLNMVILVFAAIGTHLFAKQYFGNVKDKSGHIICFSYLFIKVMMEYHCWFQIRYIYFPEENCHA